MKTKDPCSKHAIITVFVSSRPCFVFNSLPEDNFSVKIGCFFQNGKKTRSVFLCDRFTRYQIQSRVQGKGKFVFFFFTEHAMKAYWGVEVYLHSFFNLGTRWR